MAQKVYQGNDPYVFVSYSHKDKEAVFEIINDLMLCACNMWYDTGIHSGEDWVNEIAEHLYKAECVLFMVTQNSIASEYVKDELTFAKTKGKKIYPIFLENITLPLSLELLLGRAQSINCLDDDVNQSRFKLREKIKNNLPNSVFKTLSDPFYAGEYNLFYLENTSYVFPDNAYFAGDEHNSFEIYISAKDSSVKKVIYKFQARPAYDMKYSLNNVSIFDDPYFCDDDSKVLFISMVLDFAGRYPTNWPDLDIVLTIAISRIESSSPRVTLVDYKCIGEFSEKEQSFISGVVQELEQSFAG
jgi:hypothetical protein